MTERKCYVAHFDMLGFRKATLENINEATKALEAYHFALLYLLSSIQIKDRILKHYVNFKMFSDSTLVYTNGDSQEDLLSMLELTSGMFMRALWFRIPLRGGISFGDFYVNEEYNLYCGVPLVRAYSIGEEAQWLGIVLDEDVSKRYCESDIFPEKRGNEVIEWEVPLKGGSAKSRTVINWVKRNNLKINPPITAEQLYDVFKIIFVKDYADLQEDEKKKYQNTVCYMNAMLLGDSPPEPVSESEGKQSSLQRD